MNNKFLLDGHKLFWHLDRLLQWQRGEMIPPIYVEISPTSVCNHKCIFCGLDFARDGKNRLDADVLCQAIREMGMCGVRSIMFAGEGEPCLHPEIKSFVTTAKVSGIDVAITTNGSIGNEEIYYNILPMLTWIRFSVDASTEDIYAKVHGVDRDMFERVINNIKLAVRLKSHMQLQTTIGVQYLMLEENFDSMQEAIRLFTSIGVDYVSFKPFSQHPQMINKYEISYNSRHIRKLDELAEQYAYHEKTKIIIRRLSTESYISRKKDFRHCYCLPFWGYISSKADFYTCSVFLNKEEFFAGNIYKESMRDILFGKKRSDAILYGLNMLRPEDVCRTNCRMARVNEFLEFLINKPAHESFI